MLETFPQNSGPDTIAAIARAERRRLALERVTEVGMALIEEIAERTVHAPLHPEPRHDPFKGFAAVSRAIRLTVTLEAKIDDRILAMRRGDMACVAAAKTRSDPVSAALRPLVDGRTPADAELDDQEHDVERPESETDCLIEREYETYRISGDFDSGVAAIRAGLGLAPDSDLPPPLAPAIASARSGEGRDEAEGSSGCGSPPAARHPEIIQPHDPLTTPSPLPDIRPSP